MNIASLLVDGRDRAGEADAIVFGDRSISYPRLVGRVERLAAGLRRLGLRPGDRVVFLLPNRQELVELLWACFWGRFVAVPVNWHSHPDEVAYVVDQCEAAAVLVAEETAGVIDVLPAHVRVLQVGDRVPETIAYSSLIAGAGLEMAVAGEDDPAWLFYTSGTTGRPKGAVLTHRNLWAMVEAYYTDLDPVAPGSVYLHAAPLTHGSGFYVLPATGRGATNVISPATSFSPAQYFAQITKNRVTHAAFLAPTMLNRLARDPAVHRYDLSSLRSVVVGGAPLYQHDLRAAVDVFGPIVTQMYGQGEAPMTIAVMPAEHALDHPGSCGRPFRGVDVRIVGPDGQPATPGCDGEVQVRGAVVMKGYWADPEATASALAGGWLRTGDIGRLDPDDGYLHLTDRVKDVIITGGTNVYPREVEEVLLTHPSVREVAVAGIPDDEWGESVAAFVVTESAVDAAELIDLCRAHLASFKKPKLVVFLEELPKNATGKVLKRELPRAR